MSRRYCIVCGILALLAAGCEEGDGSGGGGSNRAAVKNVAASPTNTATSSTHIATVNNGTTSGVPEVFLPTPSLGVTSVSSDGGAPSIDLGPIGGGGGLTDVFAMNQEKRVPSANAVANPEPVTAMLSLMGLGTLGMTMRRRAV